METYARQVILPPPPSIWWTLWAWLCALQARVTVSLRSLRGRLARLDRLVRSASSPPALPARASVPTPEDDAVTNPQLAGWLASLQAQQPRQISGRQLRAVLRESAATAVEIRRAG